MNRKSNAWFGVAVAGVLLASGMAMGNEGEKIKRKQAPRKAPAPMEELTLTGELSKEVKTAANNKTVNTYFLTNEQGVKTSVPQPKASKIKEGEEAPEKIDLDAFVGKKVVLVGKGRTFKMKDGKDAVRLISVTNLALAEAEVAVEQPEAAVPKKDAGVEMPEKGDEGGAEMGGKLN